MNKETLEMDILIEKLVLSRDEKKTGLFWVTPLDNQNGKVKGFSDTTAQWVEGNKLFNSIPFDMTGVPVHTVCELRKKGNNTFVPYIKQIFDTKGELIYSE